jgi:hypothetical protein
MSYNILFLNELADRLGLGSIELLSSDGQEQYLANFHYHKNYAGAADRHIQ